MVATNSFRNLSNADLQKVMQVCSQLHQAEPDQPFVRHCQTVMDQAFACVHHSSELYTLNPFALTELENPTINGRWLELFNQHVHEHPYVELMLGNQQNHLEVIQQNKALKEFKKTALYNEFYEPVQGQNLLWLAYRDDNKLLSCAFLRESEFNDRELAMACLIHPHMESAWKNWRCTRSLKQELDLLKDSIFQAPEEEAKAAYIRRTLDALTARQRDVVELVAAGKDNQQIADELKISVLTVKKHLQMVFKNMDVQHRTALAAQWHRAYSIQVY